MADKPIIFSAPMVCALLEGRKTQTRRVLKLTPPENADKVHAWFAPPDVPTKGIPNQWAESGLWANKGGARGFNRYIGALPYRPGDRLWVREGILQSLAASQMPCGEYQSYWTRELVEYLADEPKPKKRHLHPNRCNSSFMQSRPSIHMPRRASRLTLIVEAVKVERLQDISEADAIAEGVDRLFSKAEIEKNPELSPSNNSFKNYLWHGHVGKTITAKQSDGWPHQYSSYAEARGAFSSLWESIHGTGAWEANPWVVALTFRVVKGNIDQIGEASNG